MSPERPYTGCLEKCMQLTIFDEKEIFIVLGGKYSSIFASPSKWDTKMLQDVGKASLLYLKKQHLLFIMHSKSIIWANLSNF